MEILCAIYQSLLFIARILIYPVQLVYVCWLAFEVIFMYIFVIETKNVSLLIIPH